jgi:PhnB protein
MSTTETATTVTFQPYIFFYGRCEEALEFYKKIFGGTFEAMRVEDSPMKDDPKAGDGKRILHASFSAPGVMFMCSDGQGTRAIDPEEGNTALALSVTDKATGERIVKALSEGGNVKMPLADAFWGGRFADVVDRFGNEWMITTP